jgi:hypothetical protein
VIVLPPPHPSTTVSANAIVTLPHASPPEAVPVADGRVSPVHSIVTSEGTVRVGAVVSTTWIGCSQEAVFPQPSIAVHVRVIVLVSPQPAALVSL